MAAHPSSSDREIHGLNGSAAQSGVQVSIVSLTRHAFSQNITRLQVAPSLRRPQIFFQNLQKALP